jgi:1,4-dihydroxy-2-naphthoyl-CoA hydrolase
VAEHEARTGAAAVRYFNEEAPWGEVPRLFGLEVLELERERVRGRIPVVPSLIAGTGVLWAPVIVGLADALCAAGAGANIPEGSSFTTLELKANFLGTARPGETIVGTAVPAHLGRATQVWDVSVTNETSGKTIALFRCTQMVLAPP